jgi:signal transduction histidine kinase
VTEDSPDLPRLLALVAHELRTPAGVVSGYLRLLAQGRGGSLSAQQVKIVEAADRSAARLVELLDEISDLAKIESGETPLSRQTLPLAEVLEALRRRPPGGPAEAMEIAIDGDVPEVDVEVDTVRLREALESLALAARRSPEDRDPIAIRAWEGAGHDELDVLIAIGSPEAVAETGPHARGTRLPYDCWRGGLGLALAIAARVVALHDGEIFTLATRPGTAVTLVRLPTASSQAA